MQEEEGKGKESWIVKSRIEDNCIVKGHAKKNCDKQNSGEQEIGNPIVKRKPW
ncbi:hypothetical protein HYU13_00640 [Candidatus Woesearchaeota archaeon]|nr:hypothetical protein [Candidatus Woesearchaeota archaeon]